MNAPDEPTASPWIISVTDETFQAEVIDRSHELPVVVDFWAAWCGPCRTLAPILEELTRQADGKFLLAKANTDECPGAAQAFRVSGIPAVFALRNGEVVNEFTGLLPERALLQWLESIQPSPAERLVAEAKALAESDPAVAEAKLQDAIEAEPHNISFKIALGRLLLDQDRLDECHALLDGLVERDLLGDEGEELQAELILRTQARETGGLEACQQAVEANPDDLDARLRLAQALVGAGRHEEALQMALEVVQRDKSGHGAPARDLMVHIFQLLGPDDPLTRTYRRQLSSALY